LDHDWRNAKRLNVESSALSVWVLRPAAALARRRRASWIEEETCRIVLVLVLEIIHRGRGRWCHGSLHCAPDSESEIALDPAVPGRRKEQPPRPSISLRRRTAESISSLYARPLGLRRIEPNWTPPSPAVDEPISGAPARCPDLCLDPCRFPIVVSILVPIIFDPQRSGRGSGRRCRSTKIETKIPELDSGGSSCPIGSFSKST
jgi:hypothetical protein